MVRFQQLAAWFSLLFSPIASFTCTSSPTESRRRTLHFSAIRDQQPILKSRLLGDVTPLESESQDDGFVTTMGVPTFWASGDAVPVHSSNETHSASLEGILDQGPALLVHNVLSPSVCRELIQEFESLGFGSFRAGKNHHGALQWMVGSTLEQAVARALAPHVNVDRVNALRAELERATATGPNDNNSDKEDDVRLHLHGLNRRWRVYRYAPGGQETFAPHIDAGFPPSGVSPEGLLVWDASGDYDQDIVSRMTVLLYLNDDFEGGETNFYRPRAAMPTGAEYPKLIASVRPRTGSVLLFPQAVGEAAVDYARRHWPLHEGSPVQSGSPKYVVRSDLLFRQSGESKLPLEDPLHRFDHLVRETFQTRSAVLDPKFLSHALPLYNPHFGVENLGPLLYWLIRFTKVQDVVEIGAGYTSIWILQALQDNDQELQRIQELQETGQNRLLDIEWTVPTPQRQTKCGRRKWASLLCIDNFQHQKETASGSAAAARILGLDPYLEFLQCDAYRLELEPESVDLLWCDFGVGSRMAEFVPGAWKSLRAGGFLLCHSTLTNRGTREWLEALRRQEESVTGIPAGEYLEISLWEPHKRFQNSVSLIQKRRSNTGEEFSEPIHSQYA